MATAKVYAVDSNSTPEGVDILRPLGNSYRHLWTLQRDTGTPAAVSLASVTWTFVVYNAAGTAVLSKTTTTDWTASGIHVDTAATGQFSVYLTAADCTTLGRCTDYSYQVTATFPAGHTDYPSIVNTILAGSVTIT